MKIRFSQNRALAALLATAVLLGGCAGAGEEAPMEPAAEPQPEMVAPPSLDSSILADERRPEADRAQDGDRKPVELYTYFGVEPGMTVADLWPGAGYNTHLLSNAVGTDGRVYAMLGFYTEFRDGEIGKALRDRVTEMGLTNVTPVDTLAELPADGIDVAVAVRNYHDVYGFGLDPAATVAAIYAALKPGGVIGIVEVATDNPGWDEATHRLNAQQVIDDFRAGGFELDGTSEMLANPADDHSTSGFEQGRQTTDRYVLKFHKPAGGMN